MHRQQKQISKTFSFLYIYIFYYLLLLLLFLSFDRKPWRKKKCLLAVDNCWLKHLSYCRFLTCTSCLSDYTFIIFSWKNLQDIFMQTCKHSSFFFIHNYFILDIFYQYYCYFSQPEKEKSTQVFKSFLQMLNKLRTTLTAPQKQTH